MPQRCGDFRSRIFYRSNNLPLAKPTLLAWNGEYSVSAHTGNKFSLRFNAIFQVNLGYPVFIEVKDDGSGGDNWSYKSCKVPVKSSPPINQRPVFYRPDALPVAQPIVSKH